MAGRLASALKDFIEREEKKNEKRIEELKAQATLNSVKGDSGKSPHALPESVDSDNIDSDNTDPIPVKDSHAVVIDGILAELRELLSQNSNSGGKTFRRRRLSKKKRSRRCTKSKARKSKARKL
jgi:hypothetical protein